MAGKAESGESKKKGGRKTEGRDGLYSEVETNAGKDAAQGTVAGQGDPDPDNPSLDPHG